VQKAPEFEMRGLLLLIGLNFEILILVGGAIWIGRYLTEQYPKDFSWYLVTIGLAVATAIHSIYRAWRLLMVDQRRKSSQEPSK
jgi:hypothetical protein